MPEGAKFNCIKRRGNHIFLKYCGGRFFSLFLLFSIFLSRFRYILKDSDTRDNSNRNYWQTRELDREKANAVFTHQLQSAYCEQEKPLVASHVFTNSMSDVDHRISKRHTRVQSIESDIHHHHRCTDLNTMTCQTVASIFPLTRSRSDGCVGYDYLLATTKTLSSET